MTRLLALDTSTSAVTAALVEDAVVLASATRVDARRHTELLMPLVAEVFERAGATRDSIDGIAAGVGPGPFTSLRVGVVAAATLGLALEKPTYGICSLDAIARSVLDGPKPPQDFLVATDARRKEVYWARYVDGERHDEPSVDRPAELPGNLRGLAAAGRGPVLYPDAFADALDPTDVDAGALGLVALDRITQGGEILPLQPLYLRQPDAVPSAGQKSALGR